ncbi:MAG: DUF503 domain-containing protein [Myxococcota bacterium]|nr:DUF503 domain-containing protein [Myxococcota bacterium]
MPVFVGVCRFELWIDDNESLKGKRSVVKRTIQRTRNRFNCAMAEVDDNDILTRAVLAYTVVGNERRFVNSMISKINDFIEDLGTAPVGYVVFEIDQYD